jgi:hypothetical protein
MIETLDHDAMAAQEEFYIVVVVHLVVTIQGRWAMWKHFDRRVDMSFRQWEATSLIDQIPKVGSSCLLECLEAKFKMDVDVVVDLPGCLLALLQLTQ